MVCYAIGTAAHGLSKERKATLVLEDGTEFRGFVFGATVSVPGEVGKKELQYFPYWLHFDSLKALEIEGVILTSKKKLKVGHFLWLFVCSIPNWDGWISRILDRSLLLPTNFGSHVSHDWQLWRSGVGR